VIDEKTLADAIRAAEAAVDDAARRWVRFSIAPGARRLRHDEVHQQRSKREAIESALRPLIALHPAVEDVAGMLLSTAWEFGVRRARADHARGRLFVSHNPAEDSDT